MERLDGSWPRASPTPLLLRLPQPARPSALDLAELRSAGDEICVLSSLLWTHLNEQIRPCWSELVETLQTAGPARCTAEEMGLRKWGAAQVTVAPGF